MSILNNFYIYQVVMMSNIMSIFVNNFEAMNNFEDAHHGVKMLTVGGANEQLQKQESTP